MQRFKLITSYPKRTSLIYKLVLDSQIIVNRFLLNSYFSHLQRLKSQTDSHFQFFLSERPVHSNRFIINGPFIYSAIDIQHFFHRNYCLFLNPNPTAGLHFFKQAQVTRAQPRRHRFTRIPQTLQRGSRPISVIHYRLC